MIKNQNTITTLQHFATLHRTSHIYSSLHFWTQSVDKQLFLQQIPSSYIFRLCNFLCTYSDTDGLTMAALDVL